MSAIGGADSKDVTKWNGTAVTAPDTAGSPKVTLTAGSGTGQILLTAGAVTVGTNNDKTGYSLTAGSYSVRASSNQRGTATIANTADAASITISSVTTTRASVVGTSRGGTSTTIADIACTFLMDTSTSVSGNRGGTTGTAGIAIEVWELV